MDKKVKCHWCGDDKKIPLAEWKRQKKQGRTHFFCDYSCSAKYGNSFRPPGDSRSVLSRKARQAYNGEWVCEDCGGEATDIHHKDRNPTNNEASNLVALCRSCHVTRHNYAGDMGRQRNTA